MDLRGKPDSFDGLQGAGVSQLVAIDMARKTKRHPRNHRTDEVEVITYQRVRTLVRNGLLHLSLPRPHDP